MLTNRKVVVGDDIVSVPVITGLCSTTLGFLQDHATRIFGFPIQVTYDLVNGGFLRFVSERVDSVLFNSTYRDSWLKFIKSFPADFDELQVPELFKHYPSLFDENGDWREDQNLSIRYVPGLSDDRSEVVQIEMGDNFQLVMKIKDNSFTIYVRPLSEPYINDNVFINNPLTWEIIWANRNRIGGSDHYYFTYGSYDIHFTLAVDKTNLVYRLIDESKLDLPENCKYYFSTLKCVKDIHVIKNLDVENYYKRTVFPIDKRVLMLTGDTLNIIWEAIVADTNQSIQKLKELYFIP